MKITKSSDSIGKKNQYEEVMGMDILHYKILLIKKLKENGGTIEIDITEENNGFSILGNEDVDFIVMENSISGGLIGAFSRIFPKHKIDIQDGIFYTLKASQKDIEKAENSLSLELDDILANPDTTKHNAELIMAECIEDNIFRKELNLGEVNNLQNLLAILYKNSESLDIKLSYRPTEDINEFYSHIHIEAKVKSSFSKQMSIKKGIFSINDISEEIMYDGKKTKIKGRQAGLMKYFIKNGHKIELSEFVESAVGLEIQHDEVRIVMRKRYVYNVYPLLNAHIEKLTGLKKVITLKGDKSAIFNSPELLEQILKYPD